MAKISRNLDDPECWGYKYTGTEKKKSFRFSSTWKKKYFIVERTNHLSTILCLDKKSRHIKENFKGFALFPEYKVQKHLDYRDKPFVCEVSNQEEVLCMGFDDEKLFHLMSFFVQAQTQLREQYEGECFVVRPDNSEAQRKIGARGNMCLLHISQWGIVLALQLCKCILGQWPLKAVKWYESSSRQQFGFEAGRKSPMGGGIYVFNTRPEQDNAMYDKLDGYVMEAAGFRQMMHSSTSESLDTVSMDSQLLSLQAVVTVYSDPRFTTTLKRISRDIYDHLSQHLGNTSPTKSIGMSSSSSDLLSNGQNGSFGRSISSTMQPFSSVENILQPVDNHASPPVVRPQNGDKVHQKALGAVPKDRTYQNDIIARESLTARKIKQENFTSAYLAMNSKGSQENLNSSFLNDSTVSDATWPRQHSRNTPERDISQASLPQQSFYSLQRPVKSSPRKIPGVEHSELSLNRPKDNTKGSYLLAQRISDPKEPPHSRQPNYIGTPASQGRQANFTDTPTSQGRQANYIGTPGSQSRQANFTGTPTSQGRQANYSGTPGRQMNNMRTMQHDSYSPINSELATVMERTKKAISNDYTDSDQYNSNFTKFTRGRMRSRSMEDLTQYEQMSQEEADFINYYQNEAFRMSDEVSPNLRIPSASSSPQKSPGFYSYASPQKLVALSATNGAYNYVQDSAMLKGEEFNYKPVLQPRPRNQNGGAAFSQSYQNNPVNELYRKPVRKGSSMRKSRSIPNLAIQSQDFCNGLELQELKAPFTKKKSVKIMEPQTDQLAFANNMFKDEIRARNSIEENKPKTTTAVKAETVQKPDVRSKPNLVLSMFKRPPSSDSTSSATSGIRSMSQSPVSPPSGLKTPTSAVKGITFSAKSKSFKKPTQAEFTTASPTSDNVVNSTSPSAAKTRLFSSEKDTESSMSSSILRRQVSGGSHDQRMEGRRLPSLPPDAFLRDSNGTSKQGGTKYEKVDETLC